MASLALLLTALITIRDSPADNTTLALTKAQKASAVDAHNAYRIAVGATAMKRLVRACNPVGFPKMVTSLVFSLRHIILALVHEIANFSSRA